MYNYAIMRLGNMHKRGRLMHADAMVRGTLSLHVIVGWYML